MPQLDTVHSKRGAAEDGLEPIAYACLEAKADLGDRRLRPSEATGIPLDEEWRSRGDEHLLEVGLPFEVGGAVTAVRAGDRPVVRMLERRRGSLLP
jgi:hypothetical protein